jgi:hypothetical protein
MNRTLRLRTVGLIRRARINRHGVALLRPSIDILIVPNLAQHCVPIIGGVLARSSGIESRPRAPDERNAAVLLSQRVLEVSVRVRRAVRGNDLLRFEPLVCGEALVVLDRRLEEIDHVLVLPVQRTVARRVESAEAGGVLAELVAPEARVVLVLRDPVRVHVLEQIVAAERFQERADVGAGVRRNHGAVFETVGGIGGGNRVVLTRQVAVLRVGPVAEVGPSDLGQY